MPLKSTKALTIAGFAALGAAACEEPPYPVGPQPRLAEPAAEEAAARPPAPPEEISEEAAQRIQGAPPAALPPAEFYRQRVTGRWSETPQCGGMSWNFQAQSFTTPGETHCAAVTVDSGERNAVRITGGNCTAEGEAQPDMTLDVRVVADTIDVTGVGNGVSTPGWIRCQ